MRRKIVNMKSNAKSKIIVFMILGILFTLSPIMNSNFSFIAGNNTKSLEYSDAIAFDNENLKTSKVSGKISINGNSGWASFKATGNCTGEGTYSNPYVIEDLEIVGGGSGSGISITNSDVYFKIKNCTISGFSNGISLYYTNNGTLIENNCSDNYYGLHTGFSDNNTIIGNIASDNTNSGIFLDNSTTHIVSGNDCSRNTEIGLYIQKSTNNTFLENIVFDNGWVGVYCDGNSNTISKNTVNYNTECGIYLALCDRNVITGNTASFNEENGIRLYECHYTNISDNSAWNNIDNGINLANSNHNTVSGNTANNNTGSGILLSWSTDNIVSENAAKLNLVGITLEGSNYNTISKNNLIGNSDCIIESDCEGNILQNNDCVADDGIPIEMIILISSISGGAVIGVTAILLIIRKRKRI